MHVSIPFLADASAALSCDSEGAGWGGIPWHTLQRMNTEPSPFQTRIKLAYSDAAFHVLFYCEDSRIACGALKDFDDLWEEDVVEIFLWPDQKHPVYFEYELSPLGAELPLLIPNNEGCFMGWRPWHYEGERRVQKQVRVLGGEQRPGAVVTSWQAAVSIPYALLRGMAHVPPQPGTIWRGNVYRMDYDTGKCCQWALQPVSKGSFHQYIEFPEFHFASSA